MQKNKNFHDTITDLEDELESRTNSIVSVNTKYREAQNKIDQLTKMIDNLEMGCYC